MYKSGLKNITFYEVYFKVIIIYGHRGYYSAYLKKKCTKNKGGISSKLQPIPIKCVRWDGHKCVIIILSIKTNSEHPFRDKFGHLPTIDDMNSKDEEMLWRASRQCFSNIVLYCVTVHVQDKKGED